MPRQLSLALMLLLTAPALAQPDTTASLAAGQTVVLAGYGAIGPGTRPVTAFHANVRLLLLARDADEIPTPLHSFFPTGAASLFAEAFGQYGDGGLVAVPCADPSLVGCSRAAAPYWLVGVGLVSRWDLAPTPWSVRPYFLPLTGGLYIRGYDAREFTAERRQGEVGLGAGIGTGFGLDTPGWGASLDARVILLHPRGALDGSLPVSVGFTF